MRAGEAGHEAYMRRAVEIARDNPDAPFGCVIVDAGSGEIVAEGQVIGGVLEAECDALFEELGRHAGESS